MKKSPAPWRRAVDALDPICWVMWLCFYLGCQLGELMCHVYMTRCLYPEYRVLMDFSKYLQDRFDYCGPWKTLQ